MGVFFLLPFFLEQVYHYTPGQSGFMLAALSVSNALVAAFGGYLADRLGNLLILRTGAGLILAGLISLIFTAPDTSTLSLVARFIVIGLGFGLFQAPNLNEILRGVKPAFIGLAASTNAVLKNLGSLVGITLIVSIFAWLSGSHASPLPGVSPGPGRLPKNLCPGRRGGGPQPPGQPAAPQTLRPKAGERRSLLGGRGALCYYKLLSHFNTHFSSASPAQVMEQTIMLLVTSSLPWGDQIEVRVGKEKSQEKPLDQDPVSAWGK